MKWDNALTLCRDLQRGDVSAVDVMREIYRRIDDINPQVNALVALLPEDQALALAARADEVPIANRGPLHGLPMAPKDAVQVQGFATAWGFAPWAEKVASADDKLAARMRSAGALFIGHSNMPEFGLGSNTFNAVYGKTRNPWDLTKTPGGSSGGAAVALTTGMLPLADGSDMGGSLRNPASFCNVVGLRPSIGRTPMSPGMAWFTRLSTTGPMAQTVADAALLFSVQGGPDVDDPLTLPEPGTHFLDALVAPENLHGKRIAYAPRLHDLPVAPEVLAVTDQCADTMANLGAEIVADAPDLRAAMEVFQVQRAAGLATLGRSLDRTVADWRQHAKDTAIWNIDKGFALSSEEILQSELSRSAIYARAARFFENYDALILPAAQVAPFDGNEEWVAEIDGVKMDTYLDWMTICCAITVTGLPAISVPGGFTAAGLPVGLQIVGKPRGDLALLQLAHTFEQATRYFEQRPPIHSDVGGA